MPIASIGAPLSTLALCAEIEELQELLTAFEEDDIPEIYPGEHQAFKTRLNFLMVELERRELKQG